MSDDVRQTDELISDIVIRQSSTYGGVYAASRVLDNNINTFNHTNNSGDEWIELDLPETHSITKITLTNRQHSTAWVGARLNGAVVSLLDSNGQTVHSFAPVANSFSGEVLTFEIPSGVNARTVRVHNPNSWLHLGEIDVFGNEEVLFNETNFLSPIGHADGGVGYHRATSNATMTNGNDVIIGASGTIDDLTSQTRTIPGFWVYHPGGRTWVPAQTVTYTAEGGDDIIVGNSGTNTFYGRSGNDWLDGGHGNARDDLYGGDDADVLLGRGGNDALYGGNGDDVIFGGDGHDWVRGGNGNDTLTQGAGTGTVSGDAGDDLLILTQGSAGAFIGNYRGGYGSTDNGNDTVSLENFGEGVTLNIANRPGSWNTHSDAFYRHAATRFYDIRSNDGSNRRLNYAYISQIDNVTGTQFGDVITGDAGNNVIRGLGGDDVLTGGTGNDVLEWR